MSHQLQDHFENLLQTEVDRREFLAYCGATLLGIIGVSSLLNSLRQPLATKRQASASNNYGTSTYGDRP